MASQFKEPLQLVAQPEPHPVTENAVRGALAMRPALSRKRPSIELPSRTDFPRVAKARPSRSRPAIMSIEGGSAGTDGTSQQSPFTVTGVPTATWVGTGPASISTHVGLTWASA